MWKNVAVAPNMLRLIGILWLILGAACNWEAIALSSIEKGSRKEWEFFKSDESRVSPTSPAPNLPSFAHHESLANFSTPYAYRKVGPVSTDPPVLLVKAIGMKIETSTADEMNEEEDDQVANCGSWQGCQVAKKRDGYRGMEGENENPTTRTKSILKNRIGPMLSMLPFMMQLWSLPGALASIKMSLLKSIFVAKLALLMLFLNVLRNYQKSEVVVVHQAQHHQHYYHDYQRLEDEKDDETSWWRK